MSVPILVKIDQEMQLWECTQMDRCTDANRFYNLSHAIWYSYGALLGQIATKKTAHSLKYLIFEKQVALI